MVCAGVMAACPVLLQVPDAGDDLLAAAVLDQQTLGQLSQEAREVLEALPEAFPITVGGEAAADTADTA